jgi:peroxiredoxin
VKRFLLAAALALLSVAPDFRLFDQNDHLVRLSAARGHKVVLVFYRGYW